MGGSEGGDNCSLEIVTGASREIVLDIFFGIYFVLEEWIVHMLC